MDLLDNSSNWEAYSSRNFTDFHIIKQTYFIVVRYIIIFIITIYELSFCHINRTESASTIFKA
ncbi:MAG: hypothetical protein ACTHKK_06905, partial [Candidatus Nitrosocosmicus sp.]